MCASLYVCVTVPVQVLSDRHAAELPRWGFQTSIVLTNSAGHIPPAEHPAALRTLLAQLSGLRTSGLVILRDWHWRPAMARTLSSALTTDLAHLSVGVTMGTALTDELLGLAALMGPRLVQVRAGTLALSTDHSHEPWPLPGGCQLDISTLDLAQAVRLPGGAAAGQGGAGMVFSHDLVIDTDTLTQVCGKEHLCTT